MEKQQQQRRHTTGEHPAAMQHNAADKQHFVEQPMLVLPLAIATAGIACTTELMAILSVITAAMSSISLEIWIVLARFRKNLFNSMCWPSASVWIARWNYSVAKIKWGRSSSQCSKSVQSKVKRNIANEMKNGREIMIEKRE